MDLQSAGEAPSEQHDTLTFIFASILTRTDLSSSSTRPARLLIRAVFLLSTWLLVSKRDGGIVLQHPIVSSVLGFSSAGAALICLSFVLRRFQTIDESHAEAIQFDETTQARQGRAISSPKNSYSRQTLRRGFPIALAVVARVHIFQLVFRNVQCSWDGIEAALPALVAVLEHGPFGRYIPTSGSNYDSNQYAIPRIVGSATVIAWASALASRIGSNPRSTVICPAFSTSATLVLPMQLAGMLLDVYLLCSLRCFSTITTPDHRKTSSRAPLQLGTVLLIAAAGVASISSLLTTLPQNRDLFSIPTSYFQPLISTIALLVVILLTGLSIVATGSSTDVAVMLSSITSFVYLQCGFSNAASAQFAAAYLPRISPHLLLLFGLALYYLPTRYPTALNTDSHGRYYRMLLYMIILGILAQATLFGVYGSFGSGHVRLHPIDSLLEDAKALHSSWAQQASRSKDLRTAVIEYQARYGRHPPPGFDKWWKFAVSKHSEVIDDFDSINENLAPFWKFSPRHIRTRVKHILSDTDNECAEVSIRNGSASIGQVKPTHRWMVDGIINMLKPFMEDLPDMDIAFNINDEPRVIVPYEDMKRFVEESPEAESTNGLINAWSTDRSTSWDISDFTAEPPLAFEWFSFQQIWQRYGSVACPPDSPARTQWMWDASTMCTACYAPHSVEQFLSNWTLAGSPCHQPDLANLHGFYLSPSAFKPTTELVPIFSQSRAGGFADILYPTAWNYNDKVKYAPTDEFPDATWDKKANIIFWHGSATEGFSRTGVWRGQVRQRLVNLVNNSTQELPVLLPSSQRSGWDYRTLTAREVLALPELDRLATDIAFAGGYPRCDRGDCEAQRAQFGLAESTDFQQHWRHRFLLDADGAGFSGRFLPFLQSHSLPFKMAIFREWYDSRLTPWKHFVPVDVRLHGLWSTLAYFAGGFGLSSGVLSGMDPARAIADNGREWANRVLRKEDMEIYFYRLLLEYARITDDNRASLGYEWKP